MGSLKTLASDSVVYGASTILGRLLSWLLTPYYAHVILQNEVGMVTNIYSYIAILLVVVSLGFETGYFRFVNDENKDSMLSSLSGAVLSFGLLFVATFALFPEFFSRILNLGSDSSTYLILLSLIVLVDAFNSIYFAELRYNRQSLKYALLRFAQVLVTVLLTVFFLTFLRDFVSFGSVNLILIANLVGSLVSTIVFLPRIFNVITSFRFSSVKPVLAYSLPLVGMGCLGMLNQNVEKILIPHLSNSADPFAELGIYGASFKIGVLMAIFTQSFRLAFEPFIFRQKKGSDDRSLYGKALEFFVYFGLIIFAGVMLFQELIWSSNLLPRSYQSGSLVIPFTLMGQLFFGVYYSLSMWYKVIDKTYFGIIMSAIGLIVNVSLDFILIPTYGFIGAGVAQMCGFFVMMCTSFILEHHYYPVVYPVRRILAAFIFVVAVVCVASYLNLNYIGSLWPAVSIFAFLIVLSILAFIVRGQLRALLHR